MIQQEKQLLLKVLCAMLPYGVIISYASDDALKNLDKKSGKLIQIQREDNENVFASTEEVSYIQIEWLRPYLRSMSSMTEEEENEYRAINCYEGLFPRNEDALDYVLEHHFDYRGLIEKGLALEAPDGMYIL